MGQFILKSISFELTKESIQKAIDEIHDLQNKLSGAIEEIIRNATDKGVEIAQIEIADMGAVGTSTLIDSIMGEYDGKQRTGNIFTMLDYAVLVEYGTGIVGANSSHPGLGDADWNNPESVTVKGETYSTYDQNNHGEAGWWYPSPTGWYTPKDGVTNEEGMSLAWTKGMPSRPFMYNTMRELEVYIEENGGRIIAQYVR